MTTFDPDTLAQDKTILQGIYDRFEGKLALTPSSSAAGKSRWRSGGIVSSPAVRPIKLSHL